MKEAAEKIVSLSSDSEFISQLERQQIQEYAREVALELAKKEGIDEGKIEIAKKMLQKNSDVDFISECTGLTIKEIKNLK